MKHIWDQENNTTTYIQNSKITKNLKYKYKYHCNQLVVSKDVKKSESELFSRGPKYSV